MQDVFFRVYEGELTAAAKSRFRLYRLWLAFSVIGLALASWVFVISRQSATSAITHLDRGSDFARQGDMKGAAREWIETVRLDPGNSVAWELLANYYLGIKKWSEANRALKEVDRIRPDTPDLYGRLAACATWMGEYDQAQVLAEKELKRDPNNLPALIIAAKLASAKGDEQVELDRLRSLVKLRPDNVEYELLLSKALVNKYLLDEARPILERVLRADPGNAAAHSYQGYALLNQDPSPKGLAQAEGEFRLALARDPSSGFARFHLGKTLAQEGRNSEAAAELKQVAARWKDNSALWFVLASVYRKLGDTAHADEAMNRSQALKKEADRIRKLELAYSTSPPNFDKALELGRMFLDRGDFRKGRYYLLKAFSLKPNDERAKSVLEQLRSFADAPDKSLGADAQ